MRNQICSEFNHIKCIANDMKISEKTVLIKKKRERRRRLINGKKYRMQAFQIGWHFKTKIKENCFFYKDINMISFPELSVRYRFIINL